MADQSKKQPRHFSKSTENTVRTQDFKIQNTVRTRSTSTTTEKFTPFNQKSTLSNNNNGKPHVSKSQ
jgi:hypothetical protein